MLLLGILKRCLLCFLNRVEQGIEEKGGVLRVNPLHAINDGDALATDNTVAVTVDNVELIEHKSAAAEEETTSTTSAEVVEVVEVTEASEEGGISSSEGTIPVASE